MKISASSTITVEIDGQRFQLTQQEAETLYANLGAVLNKSLYNTNNPLTYPPGVRGPNWTLGSPGIPQWAPGTTPMSPNDYPPGFTVTCTTSASKND